MATTTPNFGWSVPTSSDLVKNGATAIETLGDSIDASLVDLKGGTTGQVLAKATNTDMDFTWTTSSAGMTNPMTTTGDTIYSSSGSTPARLGIGSTGQVLTVAGGVPSWATPAAGGSTFTGVGVGKSALQSTANATFVAITWNTEDFDTNGYHDNSTNNTRITIPTGKGGYYLITGIVQYDGNGTKNRAGELRKNGTATNYLYFLAAAETTNSPVYQMSYIIYLSAADYLEIFSYQNSGGSLNIDNYSTKWQMQYLGA